MSYAINCVPSGYACFYHAFECFERGHCVWGTVSREGEGDRVICDIHLCDYTIQDLYASGLTYFAKSRDIFNVGRVTNFFSCAILVTFNIRSTVVQQ